MDILELISNIDVTYNDSTSTSKTVKMHGHIEEVHNEVGVDGTTFVYKYVDADGTIHSHEKLVFTDAEVDAMYVSIKDNLPDIDVVGHSEHENYKYYEGMKIKMAERFPELATTDITISIVVPPVEE